MPLSTSTINAIDLISFSQQIAQLNLGYLGISVTILGVLAGVFVYFNVKPLKDGLDKQERIIGDLENEAQSLLVESVKKTQEILERFKQDQLSSLSETLKKQKDTITLEVSNKIQSAESAILGKSESISNQNDSKQKEMLLSEMNNKVLTLEKNITAAIEEYKKINDEKLVLFKNKAEIDIGELEDEVLELKAFKYDYEGKMGGIIYTIEALEKAVKNRPYLLEFKLKNLEEKIGNYTLSPELSIRLRKILDEAKTCNHIRDNSDLIKKIENKITVESKSKI